MAVVYLEQFGDLTVRERSHHSQHKVDDEGRDMGHMRVDHHQDRPLGLRSAICRIMQG